MNSKYSTILSYIKKFFFIYLFISTIVIGVVYYIHKISLDEEKTRYTGIWEISYNFVNMYDLSYPTSSDIYIELLDLYNTNDYSITESGKVLLIEKEKAEFDKYEKEILKKMDLYKEFLIGRINELIDLNQSITVAANNSPNKEVFYRTQYDNIKFKSFINNIDNVIDINQVSKSSINSKRVPLYFKIISSFVTSTFIFMLFLFFYIKVFNKPRNKI